MSWHVMATESTQTERHERPRVETVETWKIEYGKADQNPINTRQDRTV